MSDVLTDYNFVKSYETQDKIGFHARNLSFIAKVNSNEDLGIEDVLVEFDGNRANGKSPLMMMTIAGFAKTATIYANLPEYNHDLYNQMLQEVFNNDYS